MARKLLRYGSLKFWLPTAGIFLSLLLAWFAVLQYRKALPLAGENLRGLALSLSAALETLAAKDPSLASLQAFRASDMAYFAIIGSDGTIRIHSNSSLVGTRVADRRFSGVFSGGEFVDARTRLGTGEEIYESNTPIHFSGQVAALRIALHTFRADAVIRGARANMLVLFALLALAWILGFLLYRLYVRAEGFREEMARRERFAQLGEMGASIAHEIRNPLAGIKGYAQLLQENQSSASVARPAALIVEESLRLERLVNDLLCFVRPPAVSVSPVRPADALRSALEIVHPEAGSRSVSIDADIVENLVVAGDADGLEQVFLNLLRNAVQAMGEGGSLGVRMTQVRGAVTIEIRDTGHGIPSGEWERIFVPFHTTRARGTGLGLAICKKIIEDHQGVIRVAESSDSGTTIIVVLPLFREDERGGKADTQVKKT
jgi:two-component system sensor histidine kinase HydH